MAQSYILFWSVISPEVCCKIGKNCAFLLVVPELKRIGKLRRFGETAPDRVTANNSYFPPYAFLCLLRSTFPIHSCAIVLVRVV